MNAGDTVHRRYELTNLLGKGGMAEVWRAVDSHLSRPVAIKFLVPQLAEDPEFLVRFFAEAQAVARISHPNVVKILDFGEHDGSPFLVMEAVAGGSLTELVGEPMDPARVLEIVAGAAAAAGAAHDAGIIHRDIKPANILMDPDGEAKLADFGIASSSGRSERLTATGAAIGSPHYISPEQASGGIATPASDVYALGIVLYELLTGVRPFDRDNVTAIAIAHVDEQPAPPSSHIPEVAPLDALVLRCLAKDPAARFADGNELAAALGSFDLAAPVAVGRDEASRGWWATRRGLVTAAAAVLLIGVPVAVVAGGDWDRSTPALDDEADERLPNVGGLDVTRTPSASHNAPEAAAAEPTPSPTKNEEQRPKREKPATKTETVTEEETLTEEETEPSREPTPEPTEEPDPEPTADASPSP
ncbi:MAG TPA: serine/threonine-protein kinase [Actinomycetota bacterium]|nr:serine/threonine-protein kinase [Actinomycetota bacterium]